MNEQISTPKSRPILFSTEMVKAILAGRKTQTRRIVKYKIQLEREMDVTHPSAFSVYTKNGNQYYDERNQTPMTLDDGFCPYGQVGDRLYVRETWADVTSAFDDADEVRCVAYKADNSVYDVYGHIQYLEQLGASGIEVDKWKPSIHQPRFASRITLEITNIHVERLQDISEEDAEAEGVSAEHGDCSYPTHLHCCDMCLSAKDNFRLLWDSINAKRGYSWASNPWVWCISFKRINQEAK